MNIPEGYDEREGFLQEFVDQKAFTSQIGEIVA